MRPKLRIPIFIYIYIVAASAIPLVNLFAKETAAGVEAFPRFEIGDPSDDWSVKLDHKINVVPNVITTQDISLFHAGDQLNKSECKIKELSTNKYYYPSSDISSVSYSSDSTNLNTTFWLSSLVGGPLSYMNDSVVYKNTTNFLQAFYDVFIIDAGNKSMSEAVNDYKNRIEHNATDFRLSTYKPVIFQSEPAYILEYTYKTRTDDSQCKNCNYEALDLLTLRNNKLYIFSYYGDLEVLKENVQAIKNILNSTEINVDYFTKKEGADLQTYENGTHRIAMKYPETWRLDESNSLKTAYPSSIATFLPILPNPLDRPATIAILVDDMSNQKSSLEQILNRTVDSYKNLLGFQLIDQNVNSVFAGKNAYNLTYQYFDVNNVYVTSMEIGTMVGNDTVFSIAYDAASTEFDSYFNDVKTMINSFNASIHNLTYENQDSGLRMYYPYNWAKIDHILSPPPLGYDKKSVISGVTFVSPIKGPYFLIREYNMALDYDSPYLQQQHFLPYKISLYKVNLNGPWLGEIIEWSADGQKSRILANVTASEEFFKEGQQYIPLNLNLSSLNLPNQFYISLSVREAFIKEGKLCPLEDLTDFISVPPPNYSLVINPPSLKNISIGDEKIVEVQLQSNNNLPFQVSFNSELKNLQLTFNPNQTAGVPNGITTSNLRIKVLPNATAKPYTVPISAQIILTPTFNVNNSTSATMIKTINFAITLSPPLPWYEKFRLLLSDWSSAMGVLTAIISAITGILGWGIGKNIWNRRKTFDY